MKLGWLVVVSVVAVCACNKDYDECEALRARAEVEMQETRMELDQLRQAYEKQTKDLAALDKKLVDALATIEAAQNDADRERARARLQQIRTETRPIPINPKRPKTMTRDECLTNPLAKGCS
jgi:septal ring factor EnvC (AmiA/AmiB activator)